MGIATEAILKQRAEEEAADAAAKEEVRQEAVKSKTSLENLGMVRVLQKVGESGALHGTVTTAKVADLIKEACGASIDKHSITIPAIKSVGEYDVTISLHPEVSASLKLKVIAENEDTKAASALQEKLNKKKKKKA